MMKPYDDSVDKEVRMATAIVSPKFQIVIPKEIRERLDLRPGQVVSLVDRDGIISIVPQRPISELRGIAKGVSYEGYRDETDRF
jgi:AbrB family looped-hinge helix DNA binding protein